LDHLNIPREYMSEQQRTCWFRHISRWNSSDPTVDRWSST